MDPPEHAALVTHAGSIAGDLADGNAAIEAGAARVLRPGGLLVIEDSAQPAESPELADVLADFPVQFHEPFYRDYLEDDLAALVAEAGFVVDAVEPHLVAKVVTARRPG